MRRLQLMQAQQAITSPRRSNSKLGGHVLLALVAATLALVEPFGPHLVALERSRLVWETQRSTRQYCADQRFTVDHDRL